ncbi:MAG: hypothetical protein KDI13_03995 [Alphaproteobacteria bacterium]|nr:hypothetical protein [Alphaproteobacteria bacterium]
MKRHMKNKGIFLTALILGGVGLGFSEKAQAATDLVCREFTENIRIGGRIESGYGRACLQEDGSWRIVAPASAEYSEPDFDRAQYTPVRVVAYEDRRPHYVTVYERPRVVYYPEYYWYDHDDWHGKSWHKGHKKHWKHHDRDDHRGRH